MRAPNRAASFRVLLRAAAVGDSTGPPDTEAAQLHQRNRTTSPARPAAPRRISGIIKARAAMLGRVSGSPATHGALAKTVRRERNSISLPRRRYKGRTW